MKFRSMLTSLAVLASLAVSAAPAQAAVPVAGGVYQLKVTKSGKCLDVVNGSLDNGAQMQQWGCSGSAWQRFTVVSAGSGLYTLRNVNSGRCLDVPNGAATSGLRLQQWGCGDGLKANQLWRFTASGSGTYQVISNATGLCMSDEGASTADGAAIIQETCTANTNKQWAFETSGGRTWPSTPTASPPPAAAPPAARPAPRSP
ncbi:RICIN domain-containing protein [Nonomuraea thailandensis]